MTSAPVLLPSALASALVSALVSAHVGAQRSLRVAVGLTAGKAGIEGKAGMASEGGRVAGLGLVAAAALAALAMTLISRPAVAATVQDAQDAANQHTRAELDAKRAAVQKAYDEKIKECRTRFVVTGCLEEAHAWRIEALRPIQAQEIEVNALERRQRAAAQRERVMAKDQEAREGREARDGTSGHSAPAVKASARAASAAVLPPSRQPRANPESHQKQLEREQQAAERKAAERRQAAAVRAAKQQELQRSAKAQADKRAAKPADPKKPAPAHLPTPAASDIQALPGR